MGAEVPADSLGDEFAGYVLRLTGGEFWLLSAKKGVGTIC